MISHTLKLGSGREGSLKTPLGSATPVTVRLTGSRACRLVLCLSLPNTVFHGCFQQQALQLLWDSCVWGGGGEVPLSQHQGFKAQVCALPQPVAYITLGQDEDTGYLFESQHFLCSISS